MDLLDGEQLLERVRRHVPRSLLWDPLRLMGRALQEGDPSFNYTFQASSEGGATVFLSPARKQERRHGSAVSGFFQVRAGTDDQSRAVQAEHQRFLDSVKAVEIPEESLANVQLPGIVTSLVGEAKGKSIRMAPARLEAPLLVTLEFLREGARLFEFSYLEFTHSRGGRIEGALENLGVCAAETRSRAQGSCGVDPRREEESMRGHRGRRATQETPRSPLAPEGLRRRWVVYFVPAPRRWLGIACVAVPRIRPHGARNATARFCRADS